VILQLVIFWFVLKEEDTLLKWLILVCPELLMIKLFMNPNQTNSQSNGHRLKFLNTESIQLNLTFGLLVSLCVELFEYGKIPYPEMTNAEASERVLQGYRLPRPATCPPEVYELMLKCWAQEANERPSFAELFRILSNLLVARGNLDPSDVEKQFVPVSAENDIYNNSALAPEENAYAFTDRRDPNSTGSNIYNAKSGIQNVNISAGKGEDIYSFSNDSVDNQRASTQVKQDDFYSFGDTANRSSVKPLGREEDIYSYGDIASRSSTTIPPKKDSEFVPVNSVQEDIYNSEALPVPSQPKPANPKEEADSMYSL